MTRAQEILSHYDEDLASRGLSAAFNIARISTTQRTRSKYGIHDDIRIHNAAMDQVHKFPKEHRKEIRKRLKDLTIHTMAKKVHDKRQQAGKNPSEKRSMHIAKRAFHGTFTGVRPLLFPRRPGAAWSS